MDKEMDKEKGTKKEGDAGLVHNKEKENKEQKEKKKGRQIEEER